MNGSVRPLYTDLLENALDWQNTNVPRRKAINRALYWRVGKFYYSAVREVELLCRLREEHNVSARYHIFADVLLRTDFWLGDIVICIYFANPKYRDGQDGQDGRKPPAERFFAGAESPFDIYPIGAERQGYGNFWSIADSSVKRIAELMGENPEHGG